MATISKRHNMSDTEFRVALRAAVDEAHNVPEPYTHPWGRGNKKKDEQWREDYSLINIAKKHNVGNHMQTLRLIYYSFIHLYIYSLYHKPKPKPF
jgi:hypothetical protein